MLILHFQVADTITIPNNFTSTFPLPISKHAPMNLSTTNCYSSYSFLYFHSHSQHYHHFLIKFKPVNVVTTVNVEVTTKSIAVKSNVVITTRLAGVINSPQVN